MHTHTHTHTHTVDDESEESEGVGGEDKVTFAYKSDRTTDIEGLTDMGATRTLETEGLVKLQLIL